MSLRENLNNNPAIATGGAVVVLLLCLSLIYCQFAGGSGTSVELVYYNLGTSQIELVKYTGGELKSPLDGTETYRAQLYTCTECKEVKSGMSLADVEAQDMFIGYLYRDGTDPFITEIRTLDKDQWVSAESEAGERVMTAVSAKCPNNMAQTCQAKPQE